MTLQPTKNQERVFQNMMRKTINTGTLWRGQLYNDARTHALQSPGQAASYIRIAHTDLQHLDLFKPAQFLRILIVGALVTWAIYTQGQLLS